MAQTAVCNRYHSVDHQLCRWLMLSLKRATQELVGLFPLPSPVPRGTFAHPATKVAQAETSHFMVESPGYIVPSPSALSDPKSGPPA
jgi:hypothetical protein